MAAKYISVLLAGKLKIKYLVVIVLSRNAGYPLGMSELLFFFIMYLISSQYLDRQCYDKLFC